MSVKQIPVKISAVIVDWDGTVSARLARPFFDFPVKLIKDAIKTQQEIEYIRGTRLPINGRRKSIIDKVTQSTPLKPNDSPIVTLLSELTTQNLPWFVVSDHDTHKKLAPHPELQPLSQISCRDHALKPLPDAFHAVFCQLSAPRHQYLYIGDRQDTDGRACEKLGIAFLAIENLTEAMVKEIILRF